MRTAIFVDPTTATVTKVETSATTWGELLTQITEEGNIDLTNKKATVRETKYTLEHRDAELPEGDFHLMLRAEKQEAGMDFSASSYKELREYVKNTPGVKEYLAANKIEGRNWTQFKLEELKESLKKYTEINGVVENVSLLTNIEETVDVVVEENKTETESIEELIKYISTECKLDMIIYIASSIVDDFDERSDLTPLQREDVTEYTSAIFDSSASLKITVAEVLAAEEKFLRDSENVEKDEDLLAEAKNFMI